MKHPILSWGFKPEKNAPSYGNDGMGRDTYISFNNGGNFDPELRFLCTQQPRTGMSMRRSNATRAAAELPQRLFYHSDGSGRDTYVIQNVATKFQSSPNYKASLRTPERTTFTPKYRYDLPPLAKEKFRKTFSSQQSLIHRLSRPKRSEDL